MSIKIIDAVILFFVSAGLLISGYLYGRVSVARDCAVAGHFVVDGTPYICKERGPLIAVDPAEIDDLLKRSAK